MQALLLLGRFAEGDVERALKLLRQHGMIVKRREGDRSCGLSRALEELMSPSKAYVQLHAELRNASRKRKWNLDARVSGGQVSRLAHALRLVPYAVCRTAYLRMPDGCLMPDRISMRACVCGRQVARTALLLIDKRLKVETLVPDSLGLAAGGPAVGGDRRSGGGERGGGVGAHILSAMFPDDESQGGGRLLDQRISLTYADVC